MVDVFYASIHPVFGSILQGTDAAGAAASVPYFDDVYLTAKLSVMLPLLAHLTRDVPEDTGMFFKMSKTQILVHKDTPADAVRQLASDMIHADASLSNLREIIYTDGVFVSDGIITVGVPLGT